MTLFDRAGRVIPGGVCSPARAFGAVSGDPLFAAAGEGSRIFDADGNAYLDYIQGFGAVVWGHAHPPIVEAVTRAAGRGGALGLSTELEVRLAEIVCERVPTAERVRFVTSGTEAGMTAARIARGATGRRLLVKFEGCYHGHADAFLAAAGSGVATFAVPMAAGVPEASVADTLVVPFNDGRAMEEVFSQHGDEIAAVFVEPVPANMGAIAPAPGFLERLLELCRTYGAASVFDEVVTGFRLAPGGAQAALGLRPDLTMLGKVIGGGLPVGAVAGRAELMEQLAPSGPVYQGGTYASHPHAMAAGVACLEPLGPGEYARLEATTRRLEEGLADAVAAAGIAATVVRCGTFLSLFFASAPPRDLGGVQATDTAAFARFHGAMRARGVLLPPSPYEVWFPSLAHTADDVDRTVAAAAEALTG